MCVPTRFFPDPLTKITESLSIPESFSVPTLAPTRLSSLRASLPFVDIRALQHLRHSYPSRTADIAAPHLLIMPQLHLDALHAAASVLRIMLTSLAARCSSYPRSAAATRVQHCLPRHSLLISVFVTISDKRVRSCTSQSLLQRVGFT